MAERRHVSENLYERDTSKYLVDGKRVISVTEILNTAGLIDFTAVPPDRLEYAAQRGRMAHGITAEIDKGGSVMSMAEVLQEYLDSPDSEPVAPYVEAYLRFKEETGFQPVQIEHVVISELHQFAGTLDRIGVLNGEGALIDLKCAATIAPWVALQTAGYHLAFEQQEGELYPQMRRFALRLKPDGTYNLVRFRSPSDRGDFLAARRMAAWQLKHGGAYL